MKPIFFPILAIFNHNSFKNTGFPKKRSILLETQNLLLTLQLSVQFHNDSKSDIEVGQKLRKITYEKLLMEKIFDLKSNE